MKKFILFFFIFSYLLSSQNTLVDKLYQKKVDHFIDLGEIDSAKVYLQKMNESPNPCSQIFAKIYESKILYLHEDFDACEDKLIEILEQLESASFQEKNTHNEHLIGNNFDECIQVIKINIYRRYFYLKKNQNQIEQAYQMLSLLEDAVENLPLKDAYYWQSKISVEIGKSDLKKLLGDIKGSNTILLILKKPPYKNIIPKENQHYKSFIQNKVYITVRLAMNYQTLAIKENNANLFDSALHYQDETFNYTKKNDSIFSQPQLYHYLRRGELFQAKKEYAKAMNFVKLAKKYIEPNHKEPQSLNLLKAELYSKLNFPDSAIYYAKIVWSDNTLNNSYKHSFKRIYKILAENYYNLNELDSAYKYAQLNLITLNKESNSKNKIQLLFQKEELEEVNSLNKAIKKKKSNLQFLLITVIIIVFITVLSLFLYVKKIKNQQKTLALKVQNEYKDFKFPTLYAKARKNKKQINSNITAEILLKLEEIESTDILLKQDFSLSVLAKLLNTNTSYLSRIINTHKNKSFNQYLLEYRINKLIKNLEEKPIMHKYSMQGLAESIGYKNASSFTRAFKKFMGISPSQYLKEKYSKNMEEVK